MNKVLLILISVLIIPIGFLIGKEIIQTEKNSYQNKFLPGKYVRVKLNFFEKSILYLKGVRHLPKGDTLFINLDSTFSQKTCGGIIKGKWKYLNNTLYTIPYDSTLRNRKYIYKNNSISQIYIDKSYYDKYIIVK